MAHTLQERYSSMVLAKLRADIVLKDGVVFNNDYEGDPTAGAVKVPVRDTEVSDGDYNTATGLSPSEGATTYKTIYVNKDKAVNEIVDGFVSAAVPDGIVAERLDSASYTLARRLDIDGATTLLAGATAQNEATVDATSAYAAVVKARTDLSKANVPNDGKRYILVVPDFLALLLKSDEFISASNLGDEVKQMGVIGRIAGFNVIEWNDSTANLQFIAGHPKFATRVNEWKVPVSLVNLTNEYIGSSAVQGRMCYGHDVLRATAIRACYAPGTLGLVVGVGTSAAGDAKVTATATGSNTLAYKVNPTSRIAYGVATATYAGTAMTSGTAKVIAAQSAGNVIEVAEFDATTGLCVKVGYVTLKSADIKA